jgi:hypothetical protein
MMKTKAEVFSFQTPLVLMGGDSKRKNRVYTDFWTVPIILNSTFIILNSTMIFRISTFII